MSDQDRVTAIINAIQTDETLLSVLRILVSNNLPNTSSDQLQALCLALGIQ